MRLSRALVPWSRWLEHAGASRAASIVFESAGGGWCRRGMLSSSGGGPRGGIRSSSSTGSAVAQPNSSSSSSPPSSSPSPSSPSSPPAPKAQRRSQRQKRSRTTPSRKLSRNPPRKSSRKSSLKLSRKPSRKPSPKPPPSPPPSPSPSSSPLPNHDWNLPADSRPSHSTDKSLSLPEQLRQVFRHFPLPIVICTSTSPATTTSPSSPNPSDDNPNSVPHAMTLSSLSPLSMDPTPMVSLNIMTPSRTLDAIRSSRRFAVHVLAPTKAAVGAARWFSKRHPGGGSDSGATTAECAPRSVFHGVCAFVKGTAGPPTATEGPAARPGDSTMPPILGGPAVLFAFVCRLPEDVPGRGIVQVRDHAVVMGEVEEVVPGSVDHVPRAFGMVYSNKRFWNATNEVFGSV